MSAASRDFLVEIGTEELPPTSLCTLGESLHREIVARLDEARIESAFGFMLELAYAWVPRRLPWLLVEPYIKYPYVFGEDPLVGIAPGFSLGWAY